MAGPWKNTGGRPRPPRARMLPWPRRISRRSSRARAERTATSMPCSRAGLAGFRSASTSIRRRRATSIASTVRSSTAGRSRRARGGPRSRSTTWRASSWESSRPAPGRAGRPATEIDAGPRELAEELASRALAAGPSAADPVRDLAFAGDGEPSTFHGFFPLARALFDVRDAAGFGNVPFVLITNGSGLARDEMREAHDLFASRGGTFWIKLDSGTEGFYKTISRSAISFERILANLTGAAKRHPVVVQAMFLRLNGQPPPRDEIAAWASRLAAVRDAGGRLSLVQVYTVARETMEPGVSALTKTELKDIARAARAAVPGVLVETFV